MNKNKKMIVIYALVVCAVLATFFFIKAPIGCMWSRESKGWHCDIPSQLFTHIEPIYEARCLQQGGEFSSGMVLPSADNYYFSCVIPYSDAGKPCSHSRDCSGSCRYMSEKSLPDGCEKVTNQAQGSFESLEKIVCSQEIIGECTKEKKGACDMWSEVAGNEIHFHHKSCDY